MKKFLNLFSVLIFAGLSSSFAQPNIVISPQSIVINPKPSFGVEVFVDKDSSGNASPAYQIGEDISIGVRVTEQAYVYLYNVRSTGKIDQLLPNRFDQNGQNNLLQAGETKYFPPRNARYGFTVDGPQGLDKVIAVASKEPLNTNQLADFSADPDFASSNIGEQGFAETLSIIIRPKQQNTWVTDTALFYVGSAPATPTYGTLNITSSPNGALAYVDDQFVGFTPVRFGTRSGTHTVRVELGGYQTFQTSVNVVGGRTQPVNANLSAVRSTGSVAFTSQPGGAQVYVNDNLVGTTPTAAIAYDEGIYPVRFSLPGYGDVFLDVVVSANSSQTVRADLQAQSGSLTVQANVGGALVFINGQQVGTVPNGSGRLSFTDLPAGSHELVVISPGFVTYLTEFQVRPGQATEVRAQQVRR